MTKKDLVKIIRGVVTEVIENKMEEILERKIRENLIDDSGVLSKVIKEVATGLVSTPLYEQRQVPMQQPHYFPPHPQNHQYQQGYAQPAPPQHQNDRLAQYQQMMLEERRQHQEELQNSMYAYEDQTLNRLQQRRRENPQQVLRESMKNKMGIDLFEGVDNETYDAMNANIEPGEAGGVTVAGGLRDPQFAQAMNREGVSLNAIQALMNL